MIRPVLAPPAPTGRGHLTVLHGAALYIGAVLGTGVIALPALAARAAGPASLLAWAGLILVSIPLAGTFAALGARYPDGGGVSTYVRHAFGSRAAAVVGWCFFSAIPAGAPAAGIFGGAYVAAALGGGRQATLVAAAVLIIGVGLSNMFGLRVSGRVQLVLAATLLVLLLTAVVVAAPQSDVDNLHPFAPHGWTAIGSAAGMLMWSFAGWEAITHLAAEFRDPGRDLPRATAIAVAVVGILYLAVAAIGLLVLGPRLSSTGAPLAELLVHGLGGNVRFVAAAVAVLLTAGTMNAYYAGAAKLGAALGRDGALPAWFARGSGIGEVPRRSLGVAIALSTGSLVAVAIADVGPQPLVLVTTGSLVSVYALGTAAAVRLLPAGSLARAGAVIAFIAALGLLVMTGRYLAWPVAVGAAALAYLRIRARPVSPSRRPGGVAASSPAGAPADCRTGPDRSANCGVHRS